jgi:DNA-binding CsgD family transcriptional regulator
MDGASTVNPLDSVGLVLVSVPPGAVRALEQLVQGHTNAVIAQNLGIKLQTVKNYLGWWSKGTGMDGLRARIDLVLQYALLVAETSSADNVTANRAWASLTPRQKVIVKLLVCNLPNDTVAEMTGLNTHSMRGLLSGPDGIYSHLPVSDRLELVVWYISHFFAEWWTNEPSLFSYPYSYKYAAVAVPVSRRRPSDGIHDREAIIRGTTKAEGKHSRGDSRPYTLITETADLCRVMGISSDLFPSGFLSRSGTHSRKGRTHTPRMP